MRHSVARLVVIAAVMALVPTAVLAASQEAPAGPDRVVPRPEYREVPDDPYIAVPIEKRVTSRSFRAEPFMPGLRSPLRRAVSCR